MKLPSHKFISPISEAQRQLVVDATSACLVRAESLYQRRFPAIPIRFDLRGRAAGMYRVTRGSRVIRYNAHIFAKYFADGLAQTVPHEVAHYVTELLYGLRKVRPHGPQWQAIVVALGGVARATADYDLDGIPRRQSAVYDYRCACTRHQVGARRHARVQRGEGAYLCRQCRSTLVYCGAGVA